MVRRTENDLRELKQETCGQNPCNRKECSSVVQENKVLGEESQNVRKQVQFDILSL
jgi:hypothetical protein